MGCNNSRVASFSFWSRCWLRTKAASSTRVVDQVECFVQSEKFVEAHGVRICDISVFDQEWNANTSKLAKMNLAIRGIVIENNLASEDRFR